MLGILYGVGCRMAAARRATLLRRRGFGVPRNKSDLTILECKEIPDARPRAPLWIAGGSRVPQRACAPGTWCLSSVASPTSPALHISPQVRTIMCPRAM